MTSSLVGSEMCIRDRIKGGNRMNLITQKQITAIKNMLNGFNKTELPSYLYKAILNNDPIINSLTSLDGIILIDWLKKEIENNH